MLTTSKVVSFCRVIMTLEIWFSLVYFSAVLADDDITTIALSGRPLPGFGDDVVTHTTTFGDAVLNNHGQVAYSADLSGPGIVPKNRQSYWRYMPGEGLQLLARSGDPAPGRPGEFFAAIQGPVYINDAGDVQLLSHLADATGTGGFFRQLGDWVWRPDGIKKLAYINEPTPQLGHHFLEYGSAINAMGQQIRGATSQPVNPTVSQSESLWLLDPEVEPKLIAKVGDPSPGLPSGITLATGISGSFLNSGKVLYRTGLAGPGVNANNNLAFWLDDGQGSWELVVRSGSPAPGLSAGLTVDIPFVHVLGSGDLQIISTLRGPGITASNNAVLWSFDNRGMKLLAREGNQAPDLESGVVFEQLISGYTKVAGPGIDASNNMGIWLQQDGRFELVVREGERAPSTPEDVVFSSIDFFGDEMFVSSNGSVVQNKPEQFAFMGFLRGPGITNANDEGLWATDCTGVLQLIARQGQELDVDDGPGVDMRTIESIGFRNGDSFDESFNDLGQVLFKATFTDGSRGLFLSNQVAVPEPGGLVVLTTALLSGLFRRSGLSC